VSYRVGTDWSLPIHGIGGSKLISSESKGLHNNDEAYKMAVTDALGTALKMLGMAADVYMGRLDGSKYASDQPDQVPVHKYKPAPKPSDMRPTGKGETVNLVTGKTQRMETDADWNPPADYPPEEPPPSYDMSPEEQAARLAEMRGPVPTDYSPLVGKAEGYDPDHPPCPACGRKMWDNREPERGGQGRFPKKKPTAPDFKCADKACEGVLWPAKTP
jgi:hypothetical protein